MNLTLDDEYSAISDLARSVGMSVLSPAAKEADKSGSIPGSVWQAVANTGLALPVPEDLGGGGDPTALGQAIAARDLAYGDPAITAAAFWSGAAALLRSLHGSESQRDMLQSASNHVEWRGAVALYEGHGRTPAEFETTIELTAAGVVVRGRKIAVAFADVADSIIVIGRDPQDPANLRAAIVPQASSGMRIGPAVDGLALNSARLRTVDFDSCLPHDALLGEGSVEPTALLVSAQRIRLIVAAVLLGSSLRSLDYAAAYTTERMAFGRPIAGFQGVSFLLAEARIRVEAAWLELTEAATLLDEDRGGEASGIVDSVISYSGEVATQTTRDAIQVLGGHGFVDDHPVELWYRATAALASIDFDVARSGFAPAL